LVRHRLAFVVVTALAIGAPSGLLAQGAPGVLPPFEVLTILRSTGLEPVGRPVRRGGEYLQRAIDTDGTHVQVVVDARAGDILSVTPVLVRGPGALARREGPDDVPGYIAPGPPRVYRGDPRIYDDEPPPRIYRRGPMDDDEERPPAIESRPLRPVPNAPPPVIAATPDADDPRTTQSVARPAQRPGEAGLLPPPPERFPQRVPPAAAKPAPVKRAAAMPAQPPLPKPKPAPSAALGAEAPARAAPPPKPSTSDQLRY